MRTNYVPLFYKEEMLHESLLFTVYIQYLRYLEQHASLPIKEYEIMFNAFAS